MDKVQTDDKFVQTDDKLVQTDDKHDLVIEGA